MSNKEDTYYINKILEGDSNAFSIIVDRYKDRVASVTINMLGNVPAAEDVGQEVFIRLFRALPNFRGDAKLSTYITRIAINLSLTEIDKRKRKGTSPLVVATSEGEYHKQIEDRSENPSNFETREWIQKGLAMLAPEFRSVLVLRLVEGYSVKETCQMLDLPQGTVLSRQARGTNKLKEILSQLNPHYGKMG